MKTINKLLGYLGYKISKTDPAGEQSDLQLAYATMEAERDELRARNKELTRKLAARTSGEWYWRKQAKAARK